MRVSHLELVTDAIRQQQELKFLLDGDQATAVLQVVSERLRPVNEDPARPINFVRTTYFDTADNAYLRSHGTPQSRRLRVREYATAEHVGATAVLSGVCFVELKSSSNGLRSKLRVPMQADEVAAYLAAYPDAPLRPRVTTWYQRAALEDASGRIRVTLDRDIQFCEPVPVGAPIAQNPLTVLAPGPAFLLEVKLWDLMPAWLARSLRPLREVRDFSKFGAGMRALDAEAAGAEPMRAVGGAR